MTRKYKQMMFSPSGGIVEDYHDMKPSERRRYEEARRELERRKGVRAVCPWCAHIGRLDQFTRQNRDHTVAKLLECPRCSRGMKMSTTRIFDQGPERYSEWFWDQVFNWRAGDKVDFDNVKAVARELGFLNEFWEAYRGFKDDRRYT